MPRTTLDIDYLFSRELKALQKEQHRSLSQLVSQLLAEALALRKHPKKKSSSSLDWIARPMHARIDLFDKEALYAILDEKQS